MIVGQIYPQGFVLTAASFKSQEKFKWECVEAYMLPVKTYDAPCTPDYIFLDN